jgi:succinate dehydrogenase / fumarate reductase flavoprotein subunit
MPATEILSDIDVLVIGGGIAGCFAAIKAKQAGAGKVVQVDKGHAGKSGNSAFGAGVMHVLLPDETEADLADRLKRLTRAQGFLVHQDLFQDHLEQSWGVVQDLVTWGVEFERTSEGNIEAHPGRGARDIIMFHGPQMMDALMKAAKKMGVQQINRVNTTDLLTDEGRVLGAVGFNIRDGKYFVFESKATVLATGSTWYKGLLPAHRDCTGDGYALAYRAGAILRGAENNDQISHAMPALHDIGPGLNMWQGLGCKWRNATGEAFMEKYNPALKDRAGLRNLMYAFILEMKQGHGPIYGDMTHFTPDQIDKMRKVIPLPTKMFERAGIIAGDRIVQKVEWMLCPPTGRPGLMVNRRFETSLAGLYACGEAASSSAVVTGLSAAATSGATAGTSAAGFAADAQRLRAQDEQVRLFKERAYAPLRRKSGYLPEQIILTMQENVIPYDILLLRRKDRMERALSNIEYTRDNYVPELKAFDFHYLKNAHEAANILFVAEVQLKTSLLRTESRVGLREDYPYTDNENWLKWIELKNERGVMAVSTRPVPIADYPLQVEPDKELHYTWRLAEKLKVVRIDKGEALWV